MQLDVFRIAVFFAEYIQKVLPAYAVPALLFGGKIGSLQRTKFAFKETVDRYKTSIRDVNRSLTLTIGLTVIALYAYLLLPATGEVEIPFVAIKVSRLWWIRVVPVIAYGLQVFCFTSFIWFMLLRLGLRILLNQRIGAEDDYGDVTNIALDGPLGHLWMVLQIRRFYGSAWNYLWYVPALALVASIFISPLFVCVFFIRQLFSSGDHLLSLVYSGLFIPYAAFSLLLVCTAAILGVGEKAVQLEEQVAKKVELVSAMANLVPPSKEEGQPKASDSQP